MPVKKPLLTGSLLLGVCLMGQTPTLAATNARHAAQSASQKALDKAKRDREALLSRKAREAALIDAQRKAQTKAAQDAALQAERARHFSALSDQAATALAETEKQIDSLTQEIAQLTEQQKRQTAALARRRASLQAILPVALRLARYPSTSFVALSGQADESVQGLSLIAGLARLTTRQADDLRGQEALLRQTAQHLAERNEALKKARQMQARLRDANARKMDDATKQQEEAEARLKEARAEIASATATAATLDDALTAIDRTQARLRARMEEEAKALALQNQKEKAQAMSSQARRLSGSTGSGISHGGGHGPVAGSVVTAWHQDTESGPATGITYMAQASSPVSAPCAGQIDFAGPFRSFGNMIILDCGRHYRFVLSGIGQLSVTSGQNVSRNMALGAMDAAGGRLFVQLRSGSKIIDPRPYL
ncbi:MULTISPECIES: murein hydrolase activator EnvC family protein [Asaia]|uniref:murein hydrolase activator EnvC family protein n=1 Tax=Asaia TaxID=91914 RepID=UPI002FC2C86D